MKAFCFIIGIIIVVGFAFATVKANEPNDKSEIHTMKELLALFKNPPAEYRSAPLWVWNDDMSEESIARQLEEFQSAGIGGVFIHPRPGLITSYLSDKWFELARYTVEKAKELGMYVWIYDENSYPSGFAGGHVPAEMPESYNQGQGLELHREKILPEDVSQKYYLVLKSTGSKFIDITNKLNQYKKIEGDFYLFEKSYYPKGGWFGGFSYVDLLLEGVTEKFIEVTMTGYEKELGDEFGKVVPGIFTDEPNIHPPGDIKWTPSLFEKFEERWGYDLKTNLPSLYYEIGNWKEIRHNYYSLLLEMFIDRWSKPWYKYCEEHDLQWTGHYWEHGWPDPLHGGDNMAMYAWHQMPAIDMLMNQFREDVNAQFGNVRAVKELSSVANQMGRTRTLSETYGAGGWDLRFEDMKRLGEWEFVLGVNFLNHHGFYTTIKGSRKRDHPQSFSYHEPWWNYYKNLGDYFARLSLALSSGKQINRILILEPTTTAWMFFSPHQSHNKFSELGAQFQEFTVLLEKYQIEYDLGSENIITNNGRVVENEFVVGERNYDLVIFPPGLENLDKNTAILVEQYINRGGKVVSFVDVPQFVDGKKSDSIKSLLEKHSSQFKRANSISEPGVLNLLQSSKIKFHQPEKIKGKLFHQRREFVNGELLYLVNSSLVEWATGSLEIDGKSAEELTLENGERLPYPSKLKNGKLTISFDLPPAGSLLLFSSRSEGNRIEPDIVESKPIEILTSINNLNIERLTSNVLTIDYCDLQIDNNIEEDIYFFEAQKKIFQHYGFDGNPWNSEVQYKTSIVDRKPKPTNSKVSANYYFTTTEGIDKSKLKLVVERPELWKVSVNNNSVPPNPDEYWLDRENGVFDIGKYVIDGKNKISISIEKMTVFSELESIYILGDFGLESAEKGWKIVPSENVKMGSWRKQNLPFYSDGVKYSKIYNISKSGKRHIIKLTDWYGSTAEVLVNNKSAGIIAWSPNELDITNLITEGNNEISVIIYGTLKNLLGPHHIGVVRGTAWPASFEAAPKHLLAGSEYDLIDYGLFSDFVLIESDGPPKRVYMRITSVSKPIINFDKRLSIDENIIVKLFTETEGAKIYYTLDGSEPKPSSKLYTDPITISKSTVLKTKAFKEKLIESGTNEQSFSIVDSKRNGLEYQYFERRWVNIPDFNKLTPNDQGRVYDFDLKLLDTRDGTFALKFQGYIQIEKGGDYTFYTQSNDGSKLFIDDYGVVVDNGGTHGSQQRQGKIKLSPGLHKIILHYFDAGGNRDLKVFYKGPGISKQVIPADKYFYSK